MKKLNMQGFSHILTPILVIGVIAVIGTYVLTGSHADTPGPEVIKSKSNQFSNQYLTVTPKTGPVNIDRGQPNAGLVPPGVDPIATAAYGVGFMIQNKTALAYRLEKSTGTPSAGFVVSQANLPAGRLQPVIVYGDRYSPDQAPQTLSARLQYEIADTTAPDGVRWKTGPLINLTVFLTGQQPYTDYFQLIQPFNITATLSHGQVNRTSNLIVAPSPIIMRVVHATTIQIFSYPNQPPTRQGILTPFGAPNSQQPLNLQPGQTVPIQAFVNASQPPGQYRGTAAIHYTQANGQGNIGPTINYLINLIN